MEITIFVGIIIMVWIYAIIFYTNKVIRRPVYDKEQIIKRLEDKNIITKDEIEKIDKEEIILKSHDNLQLKGHYIKGSSENTIIFSHGISMCAENSFKYANIFMNRGWNVLIYSMRRHGDSQGKYSTFGALEMKDLHMFVNWVIKNKGKKGLLGIHGESMGAATSLMYGEKNQHADFIIADCSYSDLKELLHFRIKNDTCIPKILLYELSNLMAKIVAKFNYNKVRPIDKLNSNCATLFIHGEKDEFVPTYMSVQMYEAKKGLKDIYIAKDAKHAQSYSINPKKYEEVVFGFIDKIKENNFFT